MNLSNRMKTRADMNIPESNNEKDSPIFRLNDDCMRYIFSFLTIKERIRAQRVCQRWRRLGLSPWTDIQELYIYGPVCSKEKEGFIYDILILKQVLRLCGKSLTNLGFLRSVDLPPTAVLKLVKKFCPNLRSIDMDELPLNPQAAKFLAQNFKDFTSVYLGQCKDYDDTSYHQFLSANTKLHTLKMRSDTLKGWCLSGLSSDTIEEIKITRCDQFSAEYVLEALKKLKKLRSLSIIYCKALVNNLNLLLDILSQKSNFEKFEIKDSRFWSHAPISVPNFSKLVNLKYLALQGQVFVHDKALQIIGAHCKNLSKVSLSVSPNVTDQQLQIFLESLHLEEVILGELTGLSETCFDSVRIPSLKILKLYKLSQLTEKSFRSVLQSSDKLERIEFMYCKNLNSSDLLFHALMYAKERSQDTMLELRLGLDNMFGSDVAMELSPQLRVVYMENKLMCW